MVQVLQSWLKTAVHGPKSVRIERIATPWIVFAVALVTYYCFTVIDGRQQDHKDEGDDRRETVSNHVHDYRTMCFSQSRCSQSLRTCCLHPRCMEIWHAIGGPDRSDSSRVANRKNRKNRKIRKSRQTSSDSSREKLFSVAVCSTIGAIFPVSHVRND